MAIFKTHIPDLGFPPSVPNPWFPQTESVNVNEYLSHVLANI